MGNHGYYLFHATRPWLLASVLLPVAVALVSCGEPPDFNVIEATVLEKDGDVYAEWGTDQDGKRFEHRFGGVRVRLSGKGINETAWFVRPWFETETLPLPEVGEKLYLTNLSADTNGRFQHLKGKAYWLRDIKKLERVAPSVFRD